MSQDYWVQASILKPASSQLSPQVRMAILRIIGQLVLSGFQEKIKGWGLKYVSVQLTLSTYKLVSDFQRSLHGTVEL